MNTKELLDALKSAEERVVELETATLKARDHLSWLQQARQDLISTALIERTKRHEGYSNQIYQDSVGVWTVGYGTNLKTKVFTREECERWLLEELLACEARLSTVPTFNRMDNLRSEVLIEMCYNLGFDGLMKFKNMWAALAEDDFAAASEHGLDSKWATQVGTRAQTLMTLLKRGGDPSGT
jgi:lysozyme